jgi:hypothetical protein
MGTFTYIVAENDVLERIAETPAGTLDAIKRIMKQAYEDQKLLGPHESNRIYRDSENMIAALDPNAPALDNLAHYQGIRRLVAHALVEQVGLNPSHDETSDPALMIAIVEAQRAYLANVIGATPDQVDAYNREHVARCDRTIAEIRAGNVRKVTWY